MTLTKKDKEEIIRIIEQTIGERYASSTPDYDKWDKDAIKSKILHLKIAPENYWEIDKDKKEYFTWDEAVTIQEKLSNGWRLPTRSEWVILAEEFGQDKEGKLDGTILSKALELSLSGYRSDNEIHFRGTFGYYWSSTVYGSNSSYSLNFDSTNVGPADNSGKNYGFSVRLVKDMGDKDE